MCTYNISIDDALMERVRPVFGDNDAVSHWMQTQIIGLLQQMADSMQQRQTKTTLSSRLRGIATHVPKDFDYKKELENRY